MAALHEVYQALGDPTRLEIVDRLTKNPEIPTLELVEGLGMSRQAATKHLVVLENAGIITSRKRGREVMRKIELGALKDAEEWIAARAIMWDQKLKALADYLESE